MGGSLSNSFEQWEILLKVALIEQKFYLHILDTVTFSYPMNRKKVKKIQKHIKATPRR